MLNFFSNITPIYLLYLCYSAAFLFLGVSILSKDMKGSNLKLADSLWLLALFGLLHGTYEMLELGILIEGKHLAFEQILGLKFAASAASVFSFVFLLQFGLSLVRGLDNTPFQWKWLIVAVHSLLWCLYVWYYGFHHEGFHIDMQFLRRMEHGARFTFGFTGALVTAYGLIALSRELKTLSARMSNKLRYAGITFVAYAFISGLLSHHIVSYFLPFPLKVPRAICAFFIMYFITSALNIFNIETRKKIQIQSRRLFQTEKLSSLGLLAAGIAHEINNPLANASLGIQTLRSRLKPDGAETELIEKLDAVERNIDKASLIARELLQFSRQQESEFTALNPNDVVQGALALMQYRLGDITVQQDLALVSEIVGDKGKLEQVIINILSNSLEAMPNGGTIVLSLKNEGEYVSLLISDTGCGIAPENIARVFDPFYTTKEIGKGTGLGLSICYGIIRQHHGNISISSQPKEGTMVTVKLPARERYEKYSHR